VPSHHHEFPHFLLVLRGQFEISASRHKTELGYGSVIFHEAGEVHSGRVASNLGQAFTVELTHDLNLQDRNRALATYASHTRVSALLTQLYRETLVEDLGQAFAAEGLVLGAIAAFLPPRNKEAQYRASSFA